MQPIVLATANPHKVRELREILDPLGFPLRSLADLGVSVPEPDETGATFEENATIKALAYARATGLFCLADDSGLEVDALGGRPGVISSHYCTDGRDTGLDRPTRDRLNSERVLAELAGVPLTQRTARFVCVMVLAQPPKDGRDAGVLHRTRGTFEGRIGLPGEVPRGDGGFGYDPIFLVAPDFTRTSAELPPARKHLLSHRGAAARAMADALPPLLRPRA